eukprot:scaffold11428_cov105-Isochrysis_galbana.AAC.2
MLMRAVSMKTSIKKKSNLCVGVGEAPDPLQHARVERVVLARLPKSASAQHGEEERRDEVGPDQPGVAERQRAVPRRERVELNKEPGRRR